MEPEIEQRFKTVEAQMDGRFAVLDVKLDRISDQIGAFRDGASARFSTIETAVGETKALAQRAFEASTNLRLWIAATAIALVVALWGVMAYGNQIAEMVTAAFEAGQSQSPAQSASPEHKP